MTVIKIPAGADKLTLAFNGEMSKMTDEQREAWNCLNEAAKSALAQRLDEEKTMTVTKELTVAEEAKAYVNEIKAKTVSPCETEEKFLPDPLEPQVAEKVEIASPAIRAAEEAGLSEEEAVKIDEQIVKAVEENTGLTHSLRYTQPEMAEEFERIFAEEILPLWQEGTKEYAHTGGSPFANFERGAKEMGIDRKQVLWVYAMKHKDGIAASLKGHTSQREDIRGRINDLIVYLLLFRGMVNEDTGDSGNFGFGELEG